MVSNPPIEKKYHPREPLPQHKFFSGYAGRSKEPVPSSTPDVALEKILAVMSRPFESIRPDAFAASIDNKMYHAGIVGMLVRAWHADGEDQQVFNFDQDGKPLVGAVEDYRDSDGVCMFPASIRKLFKDGKEIANLISYYVNEPRDATNHADPEKVQFPQPVFSEPSLHVVGSSQAALDKHMALIQQKLDHYKQLYDSSPKSEFVPRLVARYIPLEIPIVADGETHPLFDLAFEQLLQQQKRDLPLAAD